MHKHTIKYDRKQKYAIKVAKQKYVKSIFDSVKYLNDRSTQRLNMGECLLIMEGSLNFKLKD